MTEEQKSFGEISGEIIELGKKIKKAENEKAVLEGELKQVVKSMKEFGVSSIEELLEMIEEKKKSLKRIEKTILKQYREAKRKYPGNLKT